jgi:hypothetical protein
MGHNDTSDRWEKVGFARVWDAAHTLGMASSITYQEEHHQGVETERPVSYKHRVLSRYYDQKERVNRVEGGSHVNRSDAFCAGALPVAGCHVRAR